VIRALVVMVVLAVSVDARAECNCVSVAADVSASVQADVAKADGLYARGDFSGALAVYAKAYATSKDSALLYAQAMCDWQLGAADKAKALFNEYLSAKGALAYKDRAEAGLTGITAGVSATVGSAVGATGAVGGSITGGVTGKVEGKAKVGHTAGLVLGVIAVAAIGVVGIHSIAAGVSTSASFDPKFDIGLGVAGLAVGISAIYVAGLTAAAAEAPKCAYLPANHPIVAPIALPGGGGMVAAMTF
jgi:tetratricopeptide (TPR) repeat protein